MRNLILNLRITVGWMLLIAFIFCPTSPLSADTWYNDYKKALKAASDQDWETTIRYIRYALKSKIKPAVNARTFGMEFVDYFPYYYRGWARFQTDRHQEALSDFETSLQYGEIRKKADLFARMQRMQAECRRLLASAESKKTAETPASDTRETEAVPPPTSNQNAQLIRQYISDGDQFRKKKNFTAAVEQYSRARYLIEESKEQIHLLSEVTQKLTAVNKRKRAEDKTAEALQMFRDQRYAEAESLLNEVLRETPKHAAAKRLLTRVRQVRKPEPQKNVPVEDNLSTTQSSAVDILLAEGKQRLASGDKSGAREKLAALLQLEARHPEALRLLDRLDYSDGAAEFNRGLEMYFMGQTPGNLKHLRNSVKLLEKNKKDRDALVKAYLFLAVTLLEDHYLSDDALGRRLKEARDVIQKIFALQPDFRLEARYFSPRIVKEFER